ncbi:MAG TPA: Mur ligase family protein, partial [Clostridia bacterium]|nr:Mur ligase family protein [Clostridia bacterium]
MTYDEALAFIHDTRYRGGKDGIKHMRVLAERLGNPQNKVPMIHVAGTNGKGSVCAYLQSMLRAAGYRVGLFTSPFLERYNERMRIDGVPIPDEALVRHAERVAQAVWELREEGVYPTEFEINTAIAFLYYAHERVDIAVIEVGLGGRFDSTNIITPLVGVITTIGLDHTKLLGNTLGQIAFEKAGIAKKNVPLVLYPDAPDEVVESVSSVCQDVGAPLVRLPSGCVRLMAQTAQGSVFRFANGCFQDWQISIEIPGAHQV